MRHITANFRGNGHGTPFLPYKAQHAFRKHRHTRGLAPPSQLVKQSRLAVHCRCSARPTTSQIWDGVPGGRLGERVPRYSPRRSCGCSTGQDVQQISRMQAMHGLSQMRTTLRILCSAGVSLLHMKQAVRQAQPRLTWGRKVITLPAASHLDNVLNVIIHELAVKSRGTFLKWRSICRIRSGSMICIATGDVCLCCIGCTGRLRLAESGLWQYSQSLVHSH